MFAYLIIGVELITLYCVFWVVFIREPKPREIRAELWGHYQDACNDLESSESSAGIPLFAKQTQAASFLSRRVKARFYRMTKMRRSKHTHHIKHQCSCICHEKLAATNSWGGRGNVINNQQESSRELAEKLLLVLNKTLNKFSTKIPY